MRFAKAWESAWARSIGRPFRQRAAEGVDYDMWLGPTPAAGRSTAPLPWKLAVVFGYGTGDLGNDGVHRLDYARWAAASALAAKGRRCPICREPSRRTAASTTSTTPRVA